MQENRLLEQISIKKIRKHKVTSFTAEKIRISNKKHTDVTIRLLSIGNDETNFPHKLLLTDRQATSLSKAFANKSSANTKFLKTKLSEIIHSAGFLGRLFGPLLKVAFPASNYMFKVNNRHTRASCEICSELKIKTPE